MRNYGLNIELERQHQSDEDYIYGGFSPLCIASIPENERVSYLPAGEVQRGLEDMMDCATRGPVNKLETKFNWLYRNRVLSPANIQWLEESTYVTPEGTIEFSDAFVAIKSKTTRDGNSMKAPLQTIHECGLIPKHMLPLESWMTFEDYHNPERITKEMEKLGEELIRRIPINYDKVRAIHFKELYKDDMLILAGFAWPEPVNGEYPATEEAFNHVFMGISNPLHMIFDNYIDVVDGDFIKKLAADFPVFEYGYRVYLSENKNPGRRSFLEIIRSWFK